MKNVVLQMTRRKKEKKKNQNSVKRKERGAQQRGENIS